MEHVGLVLYATLTKQLLIFRPTPDGNIPETVCPINLKIDVLRVHIAVGGNSSVDIVLAVR